MPPIAAVLALSYLAYGLIAGSLRRLRGARHSRKMKDDELIVEITLTDIESAIAACEGGANSIELCADLAAGGVTPSIGLVEAVVHAVGSLAQVHVLVRPRPGNFCYSDLEFEVVLRDIVAVKAAGADGVVVGILTADGIVDKPRMQAIRRAASGMQLTFHRAFDVVVDSNAAFDDILSIGCDRLLTSGGANSAVDGQATLRQLVEMAENQITIVAAAGLSAANVGAVINFTNVHGVHAGTAVTRSFHSSSTKQTCVGKLEHGRVDAFVGVDVARVHEFVEASRAARLG